MISLCAAYKVPGCSFASVIMDKVLGKKPTRSRKPKRKTALIREPETAAVPEAVAVAVAADTAASVAGDDTAAAVAGDDAAAAIDDNPAVSAGTVAIVESTSDNENQPPFHTSNQPKPKKFKFTIQMSVFVSHKMDTSYPIQNGIS